MTENAAGRVFVFRCDGCLDGNGASPEEIVEHGMRQGARYFIIDATNAAYLDSPGIRWLLRLKTLIKNLGRDLRIVARSKGPVERNLLMLQVDIPRFETLAAAWRAPWEATHKRAV